MARTMEQILAWKIMPRLMMLVMTIVYIRCIEWALTQPDLSTQQASLVSVVTGAMTGSFAVWLGSEKDNK
jgi:nitrate/nitrite transporter NarK